MLDSVKIINKYFGIIKVNPKRVIELFMTSLLTQSPYMFTALVFSLFIKYLMDSNTNMMIITTIIYIGLKTISKVFGIINAQISKKFYNETYRELQNNLLNKIDLLNIDYFTNDKKGRILNTSNTDVKELANFCKWLTDAIITVISFIISVVILGKTSLGLMSFGVVVNLIIIFILNFQNKKYERIIIESKNKIDKEIGFFTQIINGLSEIKVFNIMSKIKSEYFKRNDEYLDEHNKIINNEVMRNYIVPSITMLSEAILMIYYIFKFIHGEITVDIIILTNSYFGNMFSSLNSLITNLGNLRVVKASIDRYGAIIFEEKSTIAFGNNKLDRINGNIEFQNIIFGYNDRIILNNLSFQIPTRQITAIVGESGSGKSTIFNLVLRFYKPKSGRVTIDGIDIYDFDKETYSQNVSIVKQDPFIFNMSIYDNLSLINPDKREIESVCKQVHLHDYIMGLSNGYDTIINEDATDLSGGQKQRLSIARTLLKKSEVILLDEITSALNRELADNIFDLLKELKTNHTILMITHKKEEAEECDNIIRM